MKSIKAFRDFTMVFDEVSMEFGNVDSARAKRILEACAGLDIEDQDYLIKLLEDNGDLSNEETRGIKKDDEAEAAMDALLPDNYRLSSRNYRPAPPKARPTLTVKDMLKSRPEYEGMFPDANRLR